VSPLPISDSYGREKLRDAARIISSGKGPIRECLLAAWMQSLHVLVPDNFPEPDRQLFAEIRFRVTDRSATGEEGDVPATIRAMTEEEAGKVASEVLELHARYSPS
jgi:hypothetical protein